MPSNLDKWHAEVRRKLYDTTRMRSIERLPDSTSLLFKIRYEGDDPFGRPMKAIFKPMQMKWRKTSGRRSTDNPVAPELAAYALVQQGNSWFYGRPQFLFPPVVGIRLSKRKILELADASLEEARRDFDACGEDDKAGRKELRRRVRHQERNAALVRASLEEGITQGPCVLYEDQHDCNPNSMDDDEVYGSLALWVPGEGEHSDVHLSGSRPGMEKLAKGLSRLSQRYSSVAHALAQIFVLDYLIANNDRPGNILYYQELEQVYPIDHDDSFECSDSKLFNETLVRSMDAYSAVWTANMTTWIETQSLEDLREEVFFAYSPEEAKRFAQHLKERAKRLHQLFRDDVYSLPAVP